MEQLSDGADRIGRGELDHRIDLVRKDEIGRLASAFNTMAADLEKQQEDLQKAIVYEYESRRSRELDILLKASEATTSSLDFDTVMHTLASQLLEISGFESCFISEWDKETNTVVGRLDDSRTFWEEGRRDTYSMSDYPRSHEVLLTGTPIILQGDFKAEEKKWMTELKRTSTIILALQTTEHVIGLVEISTTKKGHLFDPRVLTVCQEILANAAPALVEPLSANEPQKLFEIEEALLQATKAQICSFAEWDKEGNRAINLAVVSKVTWSSGQGTRFNPDMETWRLALDQGKAINFVRSEGDATKTVVFDGTESMDVESLIIFPLQKGNERIGVIELYDFNHRIEVTPEQLALLRTIADKASYSIENARLLGQTQKRLEEQIALHNEKEVLLKEIHHRVKNNLQIISSLLSLQASQLTDAATLQALGDSQARVRSMALIHEKLYQSQSLAKIDFGEYVESLANDLFRSYRHNLTGVQLNVQADEITLGLDQAVSCGLILNELMTNALKYAFPNGQEGTIWVELHAVGPSITLRVADDGTGIPSDFDIFNAKSLGSGQGTVFRISFDY
jgi:two-component sensor histidine kinase